ncbi:MAG: hypothetical protein HKP54_02265, partial [Boseongicola sp.]|nr:hypothetical protein [Boseongicola sp.]
TVLIALGNKTGVLIVFLSAIVQLALMSVSDPASFSDLLYVKAICQAATAFLLGLLMARHLRRTKSHL